MFTGIVKKVTEIKDTEKKDDSLFLEIERPFGWALEPGISIATNGVCLTVREVLEKTYITELMPGTLESTSFEKEVPRHVNLEPSLKIGDPLDGHMVMGHVDTIGTIVSITKNERSWSITIEYPEKDKALVVDKGAITIDGVSLTIAHRTDTTFTVNLVDYTITHTAFQYISEDDAVNIEYDMVGKYIIQNMYGNDQ